MQQRKARLMRLNVAKQAVYNAPIFHKPNKANRLSLKHKLILRVVKCVRFLNGVGCGLSVTDAINVIYGQSERQSEETKNDIITSKYARLECGYPKRYFSNAWLTCFKNVLILRKKRLVSIICVCCCLY